MKTFRQLVNLLCAFVVSLCGANLAADDRELSDRVINASVMIYANLKHGFGEDREPSGRWKGAGFVIDKERGWILTNAHVAAFGPSELRVQFLDETRKIKAEKIYVDSKHDIAIVGISPDEMADFAEELSLDCSYVLRRGEKVISVGHPRGHEFSVSFGVLSGTKDFDAEGTLYTSDVLVESGSSGGPVVSRETGLVLGINTAKYDDSDVGLLTSVRDACRITNPLFAGVDPSRPVLGFQMLTVDGKFTEIVGHVHDSSSGLKEGDRIYQIDGKDWSPDRDGELEDNLRIYAQGSVTLSVGSKYRQIDLNIKKRGSAHQRKWLYFSGMTFTESLHGDIRYRNGGIESPVITLQSVDDTHDDSQDLSVSDYADVLRVDGIRPENLLDMYYQISEAKRMGREVEVIFRDWDITPEWIGYPFSHSFEVNDLETNLELPSLDPERVL